MKEKWIEIKGYESLYEISDLGRVRIIKTQKIRKLRLDRYGYPKINLSKGRERRTYSVHYLVTRSFLGEKPNGLVVDHINNIKTDNRLCNLQYVSHRYNCIKDNKRIKTLIGASWHKRNKKWKSQAYINGKQKYLGYFNTELDAHNAYLKAISSTLKLTI